jgi:hypothetical protein
MVITFLGTLNHSDIVCERYKIGVGGRLMRWGVDNIYRIAVPGGIQGNKASGYFINDEAYTADPDLNTVNGNEYTYSFRYALRDMHCIDDNGANYVHSNWKFMSLTEVGILFEGEPVMPYEINPNIMKWYREGAVPYDTPPIYDMFKGNMEPVEGGEGRCTDGLFTYIQSGEGPNFLYTREMQNMLFPAGLVDIPDSTKSDYNGHDLAVSGRENGIVYISNSIDGMYTGKYAVVITYMETLTHPNIRYEYYKMMSHGKFMRYSLDSNVYKIAMPCDIQGNRECAYFVNDAAFTKGTELNDGDYTRAIMGALKEWNCINTDYSGFSASNWKLLIEVSNLFEFGPLWPCEIDPTIATWYLEGCVPSNASGDYGIFTKSLEFVDSTTFRDSIFTYTRSGTDPNYLYSRVYAKMLFPPNLLTIGTEGKAVSSMANGVIYISTHSSTSCKDLEAMVVTNIETLSNPNVKFDTYTRSSTAAKFNKDNSNYCNLTILMPSGMQGNKETGYFLTNADYTSTTNVSTNNATSHGVTASFYKTGCYPYFYLTNPNMVNFDPYHWKLRTDPAISALF